MVCPHCGIELRISKSRYIFEDEKAVAVEQDLQCRNPQCPEYKQVVETVKTDLKAN